jgi:hypothetical protein
VIGSALSAHRLAAGGEAAGRNANDLFALGLAH